MADIKITTSFTHPRLERQISGKNWGGHNFFINEDIEKCDFWVVFEGLNEAEEVICRKGGKILFTGEPSSIKKYNKNFLHQFDIIVTSHSNIYHDGVVHE
jgi:hypothetical protein